MKDYRYRVGSYERFTDVLSGFVGKTVLFTAGGLAGAVGGLYVVMGQIQATVQPIVTQASDSSLSVQPVTVQKFSDMTEPSDFQPALGYNFVQTMPPNMDYQLQGEQLKLN